MRKINLLLPFAVLLLTLNSCKTLQIEKPKESYLPSNLAPAMSELPLQVELDVKKLEASINKKMNGLIFDGSNLGNKDVTVKVWKAQNFTFSINNNVIEYRVPLKVWTRFAWKVEKFGYTIGDQYEANGSIALTYKTTISIDKNWKLVSKTAASGYEWIETPKLNVVGVTVPVTPIASLALSQCDKLISPQLACVNVDIFSSDSSGVFDPSDKSSILSVSWGQELENETEKNNYADKMKNRRQQLSKLALELID